VIIDGCAHQHQVVKTCGAFESRWDYGAPEPKEMWTSKQRGWEDL
jgi:hypothetical protein